MTESKICTCPSGDGSLRWPCPKHPAVNQADAAAKLTFINGRPAMCGCQVEYSDGGGEYSDVIYVTLCAKHSGSAILDLVATNRIALTPEYEGQWHADLYLDREIPLAKVEGATPAEAVLALMSAERIDPEQESVEQAGGDERAADEKPRATRCPDCGEHDLMPGDLCACGYETDPATGYACSECDGSGEGCVGEVCRECDGSGWFVTPDQARAALAQPSPAQAEQAEAERPEVVARVVHSNPFVLDQCAPLNAQDELMTVAQHAASVARWAEMFNRVEQERDAAQARVEELGAKLGAALELLRESRGFVDRDNPLNESGQIKLLEEIDVFLTSPIAQTQHSVPDVSGCRRNGSALTDAQMRRLYDSSTETENERLGFAAFARLMRRAEAVHQIAAAPGKEVPQAWLDVQAERRRQVEVEGYHGFRDNHYISYELSKAARAYIEVSWHALSGGLPCKKPESWPWMAGLKWSDGRTMLVKACALVLAEIERLDRAAHGKEVGHE
ncbi:TPA: hypothetical protein SL281_000692 [Pseudomonas aeruginosa]|nr:hypothetical protein [Pseudomonas aeruginosa]